MLCPLRKVQKSPQPTTHREKKQLRANFLDAGRTIVTYGRGTKGRYWDPTRGKAPWSLILIQRRPKTVNKLADAVEGGEKKRPRGRSKRTQSHPPKADVRLQFDQQLQSREEKKGTLNERKSSGQTP